MRVLRCGAVGRYFVENCSRFSVCGWPSSVELSQKAGLDSVEPFPVGTSCLTSSPGPVGTPRSKVLFPVMSIVLLMLGLTSCCSSVSQEELMAFLSSSDAAFERR